jgi:hypothetical protein
MVCFDSVVGILSGVVKCGRQELSNDPDQGGSSDFSGV